MNAMRAYKPRSIIKRDHSIRKKLNFGSVMWYDACKGYRFQASQALTNDMQEAGYDLLPSERIPASPSKPEKWTTTEPCIKFSMNKPLSPQVTALKKKAPGVILPESFSTVDLPDINFGAANSSETDGLSVGVSTSGPDDFESMINDMVYKVYDCGKCLSFGHTKETCTNEVRCRFCFHYGHIERKCFLKLSKTKSCWVPKKPGSYSKQTMHWLPKRVAPDIIPLVSSKPSSPVVSSPVVEEQVNGSVGMDPPLCTDSMVHLMPEVPDEGNIEVDPPVEEIQNNAVGERMQLEFDPMRAMVPFASQNRWSPFVCAGTANIQKRSWEQAFSEQIVFNPDHSASNDTVLLQARRNIRISKRPVEAGNQVGTVAFPAHPEGGQSQNEENLLEFQAPPVVAKVKRGRGRPRKTATPMVMADTGRVTRSKANLDGHRAPIIQSLVPKTKKKSRKISVKETVQQRQQERQDAVPPPVPISSLQKIGGLLEIDPAELTAEKLNAPPAADSTVKGVSNDE